MCRGGGGGDSIELFGKGLKHIIWELNPKLPPSKISQENDPELF